MSHRISIVAIFKNEHRFIQEWIEYHLKVGVDHFYLYDNGGDHRQLLKPFRDSITYHNWTDEVAKEYTNTKSQKLSRQTGAYTHCLQNYGSQTEWLQLIDLDEFLVPLKSSSLPDCLNQNADIQRIPRINFGNNGHWRIDENATSIDLYCRRERKSSHHKDMGRPVSIKKVKGPHTFISDGNVTVSNSMRIDHHYTRSLDEWLLRAKTGGGQKGMGFRVYIGKRIWLAYLTYLFLNLRSVYVFLFVIGFNVSLAVTECESWLPYLFNTPIVGLMIFSFIRGQNEIKDTRLQKLWND